MIHLSRNENKDSLDILHVFLAKIFILTNVHNTLSFLKNSIYEQNSNSTLQTSQKEFRHLFWSLKTAKDGLSVHFREDCDNDMRKADCVLYVNKNLLRGLREEIREWISDNYEEWELLKPSWYTDDGLLLLNLPADFIPEEIASNIKRHNSFRLNATRQKRFERMRTSANIIIFASGRPRQHFNV